MICMGCYRESFGLKVRPDEHWEACIKRIGEREKLPEGTLKAFKRHNEGKEKAKKETQNMSCITPEGRLYSWSAKTGKLKCVRDVKEQ